MKPTPRDEALLFHNLPGRQGCMARLILVWDPTQVGPWLEREIARYTSNEDIAAAVAEVAAAAMYSALQALPVGINRVEFLNVKILGQLQARLEKRMGANHYSEDAKLIDPRGPQ